MARSRRKSSKTRKKARIYPRGVISIHPQGYAFVQTSEGEFFVPRSAQSGAFDGDVVEIAHVRHGAHASSVRQSHKRREGRVVRVVARAHEYVIGVYTQEETFGVVTPEHPGIPYDFFIHPKDRRKARDGDLVRIEIINYPMKNTAPTARIIELLGDNAGVYALEALMERHNIKNSFTQASLDIASGAQVGVESALVHEGYRDIRARRIITIDPLDAKDFDDALSFEVVDAHTRRIGIHIADVSAYVPWESALDKEARERSCSVYLANTVVPMLPEALSNEICSLQPHIDRRCMTVDIYINEHAEIVSTDIYPAIMNSSARCTYDDVQYLFEHADAQESDMKYLVSYMPFDELKALLFDLRKVTTTWGQLRKKRGALDFSTREVRAVLDERMRPKGFAIRTKNEATSLVEMCMIAANEAVAQYMYAHVGQGLYRIHEAPDRSNFLEMSYVFDFAVRLTRNQKKRIMRGDTFAIQETLDASSHNGLTTTVLHGLIIRLMKRARYSEAQADHFGLASTSYTHFTSPIRRYPDLVVHRIVKSLLTHDTNQLASYMRECAAVAEHANEKEHAADSAARESHEIFLYELLAQHNEQSYAGVVSSIASSALTVTLEMGVDVQVNLSKHNEYYSMDETGMCLIGSNTGRIISLGDAVVVEIDSVMVSARMATAHIISYQV